MSRQIKFRAWDTSREIMHSADKMGADQLSISTNGLGFINVHGDSTNMSLYYPHLIPEQFTGLLDAKGVEIYEGDIVRYVPHSVLSIGMTVGGCDTRERIVIWLHDDAKFGWKLLDGNINQSGYVLERETSEEFFQVIGNIHENPELLEDAPTKP